jgi:RNA methyltransferase, TrmH family
VLETLLSFDSDGSPRFHCDRHYLIGVLSAIASDQQRDRATRAAVTKLLADPDVAGLAPEDRVSRNPGEIDRARTWLQLWDAVGRAASGSNTPEDAENGAPPQPNPQPIPQSASQPAPREEKLPLVFFLDGLRSPFNVGNIIRSAAAFGIRAVVLGEGCPDLNHPRLLRAAMDGVTMVPCFSGTLEDARSFGEGVKVGTTTDGMLQNGPGRLSLRTPLPLWALETGGRPLRDTPVDLPAVVALGHEEYGVSQRVRSLALASGGVVTIPHAGRKQSLNVGVAAGILLYQLSQGL